MKRRIVFWINGERGKICAEALLKAGYVSAAVVAHAGKGPVISEAFEKRMQSAEVPVWRPEDPNARAFGAKLKALRPDLFLLLGYGKILSEETLGIPAQGSWNCHGGKVPEHKGSSPLNWVLIRGEKEFGVSLLEVDRTVDGGGVIDQTCFVIGADDTIRDLHEKANHAFVSMLLKALKAKTLKPRKQDDSKAGYFPMRFPEDGLIVWDMMTAKEIHDRIRALTEPYPCAFSFYEGKKIRLIASRIPETNFYGEPGRVYRISEKNGMLVGAKDKALWITRAAMDLEGKPFIAERYTSFVTCRTLILESQAKAGKGAFRAHR